MSELFDLLKEIEADFGVRVCVHEVSGITFTIPSLALPYLWKTHGGQYCTAAKKATSERACMRQKEIALHKLQRNGGNPFCGICRMGVCDYVEPVKLDERLVAVVFASGVIREKRQEAEEKLLAHIVEGQCYSRELMQEYKSFVRQADVTETQLHFFAKLVKETILNAAQMSSHRVVPSKDYYPVESVRTWRQGMAAVLIAYLEENYRNKITLKMLSQRFLLSEGHINRLVRREVHMGAMAYVKQFRLEKASKELTETAKPINEIGEDVGYPDSNYFCRAFKASYGMTPTEYRTRYSEMHNKNKNVPIVL